MSTSRRFLKIGWVLIGLLCNDPCFGATHESEVEQVEVEGVTLFNRPEIESTLEISRGIAFDQEKINQTLKNIKNLYKNRGYFHSSVDVRAYKAGTEAGARKVIVRFKIEEGFPTRVRALELFSIESLRGAGIKTWRRIQDRITARFRISPGEIFSQDRLTEYRKVIQEEMLAEDFFRSKVLSIELNPVAEPGPDLASAYPVTDHWMDLGVKVQLGEQIRFTFRGNELLTKAELQELIEQRRVVGFTDNYSSDIRTSILDKYATQGYPHTAVAIFTFENPVNQERTVSFHIMEGARSSIKSIRFDGSFTFKSNDLLDVFYKSVSINVANGDFVEAEIQRGAESVVEWMKTKGFLGSKLLSVTHVGNAKGTLFDTTVYLYEGDQTFLAKAVIEGSQAVSKDEIEEILQIKVGTPFNPFAFSQGLEELKRRYRALGYLDMKVPNENLDSILRYSQKNRIAELRIQIEEGAQARVSSIEIEGLSKTLPKVVRRELEFSEGEVLTSEGLRESEINLQRLGIFSNVSIQVKDDPKGGGKKEIILSIEEGSPGSVGGGIGFRNDLGLKLFSEVGYTNLWGSNHTWSIAANANRRFEDFCKTRTGTEGSICFVEYEARISYIWPWFLLDRVTFQPELSVERRRYFQFDALSTTFKASFERRLLKEPQLTASLVYSLERTKQENALFAEDNQTLTIGSVTPGLRLDLRDNPLAPTRGFFATASYEIANSIFGSQSDPAVGFTRLQFRADQFVPLWGNISWYSSFRTGYERNTETSSSAAGVPLIKQFTLGGAGSLRGYKLQELNVQNFAIQGSLSFVNFRTQVDFPVAGALKMGPFLDAGNLLLDRYSFGPLRYAAGIGIRYDTPVGPVNLDWGYKLNPIPGTDLQRVHFSVGIL